MSPSFCIQRLFLVYALYTCFNVDCVAFFPDFWGTSTQLRDWDFLILLCGFGFWKEQK